jgi:hypothetical protein
MGILGNVQLVKRTRLVTLGVASDGTKLEVTVSAPPLQLSQEIATKIPSPDPPPKRDSNGKVQFKRDPRTGAELKIDGVLVPLLDYSDAKFVAEAGSVKKARTIALIFACTEFPGESAVTRNGHSPVAFELARWKELEDGGVDLGAWGDLNDALNALCDPMTVGEIEEARRELGADEETQKEIKARLGKDAPKGK